VRRAWPFLWVALVIAAGGCQAFDSDRFVGQASCEDVESTMCARLVAEVAADRNPNTSAVAVRCAAGPCDAGSGEVTIAVSFADGTTAVRNVAWNGNALPMIGFPTVPTCEGIEVDPCMRQAANSWRLGEADRIVAIHLRCDEGLCGPFEGVGSTRLTFRDGSVREESWGYAMAPEPAPIAP
jgi:hypothetical protein